MHVTVMSYNIRRYGQEDFPEHHWNARKTAVGDLVRKHNPDILCTQEDHPIQLTDIASVLPHHKHYGFYNEQLGGAVRGAENAIFYNTTLFTLHSSGYFWLTQTPKEQSRLSQQSAHHRTCTYVCLEQSNGKRFFVFNTHFDHFSSEIRHEEARILLDHISRIAGNNPIILCADLNEEQKETPTTRLIADVFPCVNPIDPYTVTYPGWIEFGSERCSDFIFSHFPAEKSLVDTFHYQLPNGEATTPSDHYPLISILSFSGA